MRVFIRKPLVMYGSLRNGGYAVVEQHTNGESIP
jgi:hypothetical protein